MILPGLGCLQVSSIVPFPTQRGSVQSSTQNSGTSFAVTLPSHQAGDTIVVFVGYVTASNQHVSGSAGWTELVDGNQVSDYGLAVYKLLATGSSHTLTITNAASGAINAHAYVFKYSDGTVEAATAQGRDPPSLTPSWGAGQTVWMVGISADALPATGPTGFGSGIADTAPSLATMAKEDTSATLDPSTFSAVNNATSVTVAVKSL